MRGGRGGREGIATGCASTRLPKYDPNTKIRPYFVPSNPLDAFESWDTAEIVVHKVDPKVRLELSKDHVQSGGDVWAKVSLHGALRRHITGKVAIKAGGERRPEAVRVGHRSYAVIHLTDLDDKGELQLKAVYSHGNFLTAIKEGASATKRLVVK